MNQIFSLRTQSTLLCMSIAFVFALFFVAPLTTHAAGLVPCGGYTEEGAAELPCNFGFFMAMLNGIISFLLFKLAMPLAALMFAYAGILYITSGVKPEQREQAKKILTNVIWGLIIALAAWLIVHTILTSLDVGEASIFLSNPSDTVTTD